MVDSTTKTIKVPGTEIPKTGAALNVANLLYLDKSGKTDIDDIGDGQWVRIAKGITDITPSAKEKSQATAYYDGDGYDTTEVTGKAIQLAVKGVRYIGDPGQDYIYSKTWSFGDSVKTRALWINNGDPVLSQCTLTAITPTGGNADAAQTFSLTIAFNGAPKTVNGSVTMTPSTDQGANYFTATVNTSGTNKLLPNGTGAAVQPSSAFVLPSQPTTTTSDTSKK